MELTKELLENLILAPRTCGVTVLARHSERYPITSDEEVFTVGLTENGIAMAEALGVELRGRYRARRLGSSPVGRCVDTVAAVSRGAGWKGDIQVEDVLSHPFQGEAWDQRHSYSTDETLPEEVVALVDFLLGDNAPVAGEMDFFCTHDTVLGTLLEYCAGQWIEFPENWPNFLEGVVLWRDGGDFCMAWRGEIYSLKKALRLNGELERLKGCPAD